MRVWAMAILLAAGAVWFFWPEERPERSERREALPERVVVPPSTAPERVVEPATPKPPHGFVRGPSGEPVVDAQVRLNENDPIPTDAEGRYEFEWPKDAKRVTIGVKHHAYLDVEEERADSFDFTLERGLSVSGRVVFPSGLPVPGWAVQAACPGDRGPRESSWMRTDEDGRFELTGLLPGLVWVWTNDGGTESATRKCDAGTSDLRFVLKCSVLRISIHLPNGKPAVGASVSMGWKGVELSGLQNPNVRKYPVVSEIEPGLDVDLSVSMAGCRALRQTIPSWATTPRLHTVRIDLECAGRAAVLLDIWTPGAIRPKAVAVEVVGTTRKEEFNQVGARMLRLDDFDPGPVVLRVYAPDQPFLVREISVVAIETEPRPTRVELPRGARVRVVGAGAGEYVGLRPVDSKIQFLMMRDGNELVSYADVPEGAYVLFGFKDGKRTREVEVTVKGTKENKFDWTELSR